MSSDQAFRVLALLLVRSVALVAPVLGDGSTVVAVGYDEPGLDALAVSERATR